MRRFSCLVQWKTAFFCGIASPYSWLGSFLAGPGWWALLPWSHPVTAGSMWKQREHRDGSALSNCAVRGQERAETFAFSASSSWEVEKVLLLMDKPRYCLKSRLLIKGCRVKAKLLKENRSPECWLGLLLQQGGAICAFSGWNWVLKRGRSCFCGGDQPKLSWVREQDVCHSAPVLLVPSISSSVSQSRAHQGEFWPFCRRAADVWNTDKKKNTYLGAAWAWHPMPPPGARLSQPTLPGKHSRINPTKSTAKMKNSFNSPFMVCFSSWWPKCTPKPC